MRLVGELRVPPPVDPAVSLPQVVQFRGGGGEESEEGGGGGGEEGAEGGVGAAGVGRADVDDAVGGVEEGVGGCEEGLAGRGCWKI